MLTCHRCIDDSLREGVCVCVDCIVCCRLDSSSRDSKREVVVSSLACCVGNRYQPSRPQPSKTPHVMFKLQLQVRPYLDSVPTKGGWYRTSKGTKPVIDPGERIIHLFIHSVHIYVLSWCDSAMIHSIILWLYCCQGTYIHIDIGKNYAMICWWFHFIYRYIHIIWQKEKQAYDRPFDVLIGLDGRSSRGWWHNGYSGKCRRRRHESATLTTTRRHLSFFLFCALPNW